MDLMDILLSQKLNSGGGGSGGGGGSQTITDYIASIGEVDTVSLGTTWSGSDPYTSTVTLTNYAVTDKTLVNILPDPNVVQAMMADGITEIFITNNNGVLTATALGGVPSSAMTLNVLCTESDFVANLEDYRQLTNKPQINDVELDGNKTTKDLGIQYGDIENTPPLVYREATGNRIAMFGDASGDVAIKETSVQIRPKQEGSGNPSSDNVRPISGWTQGDILHVDEYHCHAKFGDGSTSPTRSGSGTPSPDNPRPLVSEFSFTCNDGTTITVYGSGELYSSITTDLDTGITITKIWLLSDLAKNKIKNATWEMVSPSVFKCDITEFDPEGALYMFANTTLFRIYMSIYDTMSPSSATTESALIANLQNYQIGGFKKQPSMLYIRDDRYTTVEEFIEGVGEEDIYYNWKESEYPTTNERQYGRELEYDDIKRILNQIGPSDNLVAEIVSVNWNEIAGTIYGGSFTIHEDGAVDIISNWDFIESYNGETLPGEWISSMDVYSEGATPTIGAQVAYKTENALTYSMKIDPIVAYEKSNEFDSHCGNVNVKYQNNIMLTLNGYADKGYYAKSYIAGLVRPGYQAGLQMTDAYGSIAILKATDAQVKAGTDTYAPIVPSNQKNSVFYGLAAAAGDTTQSKSNNAIGKYTESAMSAIYTMLNGTVSVTGTTPTIAAKSGITYVCGTVTTLDITSPTIGIYDVIFHSGSTPTVLTATGITWMNGFNPKNLEANTTYEINILNGYGVAAWA